MQTNTNQAPAPELFTDSAESTSAVFTELYNAARPTIKAYIEDLIKIDRHSIETNPGTPFIFGCRETGTGLSLMYKNMAEYESAGLKVGEKYIFGTIRDEQHKIEILKAQKQQVTYIGAGNTVFYYYDGHKLRKSTREKCEEIHSAHIDKIIRDAAHKAQQIRTQYSTAA